MNKEKTTKNSKASTNQNIIDEYDYLGKSCSSMDCTGLIPSAPVSDAQLDSYEALYPYLPPAAAPKESEDE